MIGNLLRISEEDLQEVLEDPEAMTALVFPEEEARLPEDRHLQIERVWHILHFLLTGSPWDGEGPAAKVILGGTALGDDDVGYRPAQYLSSEEVREVSLELSGISGEQLWEKLDPAAMRDVALYAFNPSNPDAVKAHALGCFERIKIFYRQAAEAGQPVIKYLS